MVLSSYGNDRVVNRGVILSGDDAVDLGRGTDRVDNYGRIETTGDGAVMCFPETGQTCYVYNYALGILSAPMEVVDVYSYGGNMVVYNEGAITSSQEEGLHIHGSPSVSVTNRGTIHGNEPGVKVGYGTGTITNYGYIESNHNGIDTHYGNDTIRNYGTVRSYGESSIAAGSGNDTITNTGSLISQSANAFDPTLDGGPGADKITLNGGAISQTGAGAAVEGGTGSDIITIVGGTTIEGVINGDAYNSYAAGDWDILVFRFTSSDQAEMDAFVAAVRSQSPRSGSAYTWRSFEEIKIFFNGVRVATTGSGGVAALQAPVAWLDPFRPLS